jgi:hypothetical protein
MARRSKTSGGVVADRCREPCARVYDRICPRSGDQGGNPKAAAVKNPVQPTPKSITGGRQAYMRPAGSATGQRGTATARSRRRIKPAQSHRRRVDIRIQRWRIFAIISNGVGGDSEMKGHRSEMTANDMWNIVNYLRSIGPQTTK